MFLWFIAAAVFTVLFVFDSPAIDYRFVALGAVLPLVETISGRPLILHTLIGSVAALGAVMLTTRGKRVLRRRLLGTPIGMFIFLVASAAWTHTGLFWWPVAGLDGIAAKPIPEFNRPLLVLAMMEVAGFVSLMWLGRRLELARPDNRRQLVSTGRLPREHLR